jgi:hypothetical protein
MDRRQHSSTKFAIRDFLARAEIIHRNTAYCVCNATGEAYLVVLKFIDNVVRWFGVVAILDQLRRLLLDIFREAIKEAYRSCIRKFKRPKRLRIKHIAGSAISSSTIKVRLVREMF